MRSRLLAWTVTAALVVLAACSGGSLVESTRAVNGSLELPADGLVSTSKSKAHPQLVYCKPFDEARSSATIGMLGGTIRVGPHNIWIPPGALLSPTTITAKIVKNDYTNSVQFFPEGLKFITPALVTLSYSNCDRQTQKQALQVVHTTDDLLQILALLPSINDTVKKTTTGTLEHFSRYAVAY